MQGVVRCLRDGTAGSTSGDGGTLVIVQDSLDVLGGPAIFQRVLGDLCNAINAGRAQATRGVVVALQTPPDVLRECVAGSPLSVLDCHSDPHGWLATAEHAPAEQQLGGGGQRVTGASLQLGAAGRAGAERVSGGTGPTRWVLVRVC